MGALARLLADEASRDRDHLQPEADQATDHTTFTDDGGIR
jgi:hypothetical protein